MIDIPSLLMGRAMSGGGGGSSPILAWDFTSATPLIDTVRGIPAQSNNITFDANGAKWDNTGDFLIIPSLPKGITIEVDVAEMTLTPSNERRFITRATNGYGFVYRSTGKWSFSINGSWEDSDITDGGYFSGHTAKIVIDEDSKWHIFRDNDLVFEPTLSRGYFTGIVMSSLGSAYQTAFYIGNPNNAMNNAIISAVRIY